MLYLELITSDNICLNEDYVLCNKATEFPPLQNYSILLLIFFSSYSYVDYLIEMLRSLPTLTGNFKPDFSMDLGANNICKRLETLERELS
jgi:hypothetical protein